MAPDPVVSFFFLFLRISDPKWPRGHSSSGELTAGQTCRLTLLTATLKVTLIHSLIYFDDLRDGVSHFLFKVSVGGHKQINM